MSVLDGYRVGGVRLYTVEWVLVCIKRWRCRAMKIVVCRVTDIMAITSENVSCFHRW